MGSARQGRTGSRDGLERRMPSGLSGDVIHETVHIPYTLRRLYAPPDSHINTHRRGPPERGGGPVMPAMALASSPEKRSFPVPPPVERKDLGNSDGVDSLFTLGSYLSSLLLLFRLCPAYQQTLGQQLVVPTRDWRKIQNDWIEAVFVRCASQLFRTVAGPTGHSVCI